MAQKEPRIAIGFDGPSHYHATASSLPRLDGRAALKRRLLEKRGWRLLSVSHFEWSALRSAAERQEYFARLLAGS